jgi:phage-related protein
LRPPSHRILFFYWRDNRFILLHHFMKRRGKHRRKRYTGQNNT